jgi:hypothetical protein
VASLLYPPPPLRQYVDISEEGGDTFIEGARCNFTGFFIDYTYHNLGAGTVDQDFSNELVYDGDMIWREVGQTPLQVGVLLTYLQLFRRFLKYCERNLLNITVLRI